MSICTSVGFRTLEVQDYIDACEQLKPDLAVSAVDLAQSETVSAKRIEKSADRTHAWLRDTLSTTDETTKRPVPILASIPPWEKEQQYFYLRDLVDEYKSTLAGLSLYAQSTADAIPAELHNLLRLSLTDPPTPHSILTAVSLGIDLITVPFVTRTSEHGLAFCFSFPAPEPSSSGEPLAIDLWPDTHATALTPLTPSCTCYTCTRHHRAYVHHLLQAKEMLAWTLLQIHNLATLDAFFAGVRHSLTEGTFEADVQLFRRVYADGMPAGTGQGPRMRGYQVKSVGGGEPKKNVKAYGRLEERVKADDRALREQEAREEEDVMGILDDVSAEELTERGLGEVENNIARKK